jgi:hypothetical protein
VLAAIAALDECLRLYVLCAIFCAGRLSRDPETSELFRERRRRWGVSRALCVQLVILTILSAVWPATEIFIWLEERP